MRHYNYKNIILLCVAVFLLLGTFVGDFVFAGKEVKGSSMENALKDGEHILINKLTYRFHPPKRYDVVVFPSEKEKNTDYIKRIIGLPGETIQIINSSIYIDGKLLYENYGKESIDEYSEGIAREKIQLGENEYFVLGDNRNNSTDSRDPEVGPVKGEDILGKAVFCVYPFSSFGRIGS